MPKTIALVITNTQAAGLDTPSHVADVVGDAPVLTHTLRRLSRVRKLDAIVLVHPEGQSPRGIIAGESFGKSVESFAYQPGEDRYRAQRVIARRWAIAAWRGGLGGATCYDELLPAQPLAEAMAAFDAKSALLIGGDWMLVEPTYGDAVLEAHLSNPDALRMTFTQAPPGLAAVALARSLVDEMAQNPGVNFGRMLGYTPTHAQADPIGKDVCLPIEPAVRGCVHRFIYDLPRSRRLIDAIASHLEGDLAETPATELSHAIEAFDVAHDTPRHITLELNTIRRATGPATPQHYASFKREPIDFDLACRVIDQTAEAGDITLTLGGLGDALLYDRLPELLRRAKDAGVFTTAIETDLLVDDDAQVDALLDMPVDVISVRLNADSKETYERVMGVDAFGHLARRMELLINERNRRSQAKGDADSPHIEHDVSTDVAPLSDASHDDDSASSGSSGFLNLDIQPGSALMDGFAPEMTALPTQGVNGQAPARLSAGVPWVVPRFVKLDENLADMEMFYDRWLHYAGHAVIEPAPAPRDSDAAQAPQRAGLVHVHPPASVLRAAATTRMLIHADGRCPLHEDDWPGEEVAGDVNTQSLSGAWQALIDARLAAPV